MTNAYNPKISVIIPVYNMELYINRCLNSIIEQTFTDFEVILVNDNSQDASPSICNDYSYKDKRIRVIHNSVNQGSSISRKIGLDNSYGEYIQFIDSDDWIERNMFDLLYSAAVYADYDVIWHDFFDYDLSCREQNIDYLSNIEIYKNFFDNESGITPSVWNKFTKREILLQVNFPKAMQWEDLVISVQLINKAVKIKHLPEAFYHHVNNPSSVSKNKERKIKGLMDIFENLTVAIDYCREYLSSDFIQLEPELSACVNRFKFEGIFIKELRNSNLFLQLYPESVKNIFCKTWKTTYYKKLFLYAYIKNIPGFSLLIELIRCVKY
jgi:glycosyltransferase involved in cell wall biosynthesis